jgi:hypothetical protein
MGSESAPGSENKVGTLVNQIEAPVGNQVTPPSPVPARDSKRIRGASAVAAHEKSDKNLAGSKVEHRPSQ